MNCIYCNGDTNNKEGICNICMIFGPPIETQEETCDIEKQYIGTNKGLHFYNSEYNYLNPSTIQSFRQNIPELIVRDCIKEFNLDDEQAEKLRMILMARGVNKWFYVRREFIRLKHYVKEMLKSSEYPYGHKEVHKIIQNIYTKMQKMSRTSRWVKWPNTITHKWKNIEKIIEIKGKRR